MTPKPDAMYRQETANAGVIWTPFKRISNGSETGQPEGWGTAPPSPRRATGIWPEDGMTHGRASGEAKR